MVKITKFGDKIALVLRKLGAVPSEIRDCPSEIGMVGTYDDGLGR